MWVCIRSFCCIVWWQNDHLEEVKCWSVGYLQISTPFNDKFIQRFNIVYNSGYYEKLITIHFPNCGTDRDFILPSPIYKLFTCQRINH